MKLVRGPAIGPIRTSVLTALVRARYIETVPHLFARIT